MRRLIAVLLCLNILALTTASDLVAESFNKFKIVCTVGMITDIAKNVAGDRAEVIGLISSGIDPHLYKPTRSDIAKLNRAQIIFYNGLLLEGKMSDALIRVASSGKKVYAVTELIERSYLLEPKEFSGHYDPHVWMDPEAWSIAAQLMRDKLSEFDPLGKRAYQRNTDTYLAHLKKLDKFASEALNTVPYKSRVLITAHDAFNYFGRRYGFEVIGIQGISTDSEAGVRDIEKIVGIIIERKIEAVFVESTVSERNVQALVEGAKAEGHEVKIGGQLYSDAMGQAGTYEGTYIGMIDHNVTTISNALGGKVVEGGMQGKLAAKG